MAMTMEKKKQQQQQRTAVTKSAAFHACLSPPLWKDQLRARCMERVKQNRQQLLAKLRTPDANVVDEMTRLVYREERRQDKHTTTRSKSARRARHPVFDLQRETQETEEEEDDCLVTIDELMMTGQLSEQDYLEIVTSLEDELRQENDEEDREDERRAQEMMEFEEASLAAMLSGMDLEGVPDFAETQDTMKETTSTETLSGGNGIHVLCPVCKADSLRESSVHSISCSCGFDFCVQNLYHGALLDFQEMITCAFMGHREHCSVDPSFEAIPDFFGESESDSLLMYCRACRHEVLF